MSETEDLYEILQLHPSASREVIEAAYRQLALLYHPSTDPSPEAAGLLAAVSRAYAILGDPEKRAEYDRSREVVQAEEESAEGAPPRGRTRQSDLDYITIGSCKDDVSRIQGPPLKTSSMSDIGYEGETWQYGSGDAVCIIRFSKAGRVEGWQNRGDLKVRMVPGLNVTASESFSIGSHKDDVARLQGTPVLIIVPRPRTKAAIQEEREHRKLMREIDKELGRPKDPEYYKQVGKFDDDENSDLELWRYCNTGIEISRSSIVEFSIATGRVTAWDNKDGSLKVQGISPETQVAKDQRRTASASAPIRGSVTHTTAPAPPPLAYKAQGCGSLLAVLGLLAIAAMAAVFLA